MNRGMVPPGSDCFPRSFNTMPAYMKNKKTVNQIGRAEFIKRSAISFAGLYIIPRHVLGGRGFVAPSDKLYIAAVGCGGEGSNDINHYNAAPKKNAVIAFLCDVDERMAVRHRKNFPQAGF